ncbi:MAG: dihydrolipoyl dehydrogenase [Deltaproteobacteria bacterium]|nr:dihydrolipoyl dehydrogenase [Deltaproteobacteria bacterium]
MDEKEFDLVVIGAGPGGYVAAIRAAQLGMKVACVEKEQGLGGTCLNVGCIPSKTLLESSELYWKAQEKFKEHGILIENLSLDFAQFIERKNKIIQQLNQGIAGLFKKNKVISMLGTATIDSDKTVHIAGETEQQVRAKTILIATGGRPVTLPGIEIDQRQIIDSTGALALKEVPQRMIVMGGGSIGIELGCVYRRLGSEVTIVEALDRIVPTMDREISRLLQRILEKQGLKFQLSSRVQEVKKTQKGVTPKGIEVVLQDSQGKVSSLGAEILLVAVGRKPMTEGLGLEAAGIKTDEKGRIICDENFQTSLLGVYAVGDVIAGPMLAHKASEEGLAVVEHLAGKGQKINYQTLPSVIYTSPEVAAVGMTEEGAKEKGLDYKVGKFWLLANGRAMAMGERDGLVKLIADKKTDQILGAHLIVPHASDMIAEVSLAIGLKAKASDLARTIHAHPTLAEMIKEAAHSLSI